MRIAEYALKYAKTDRQIDTGYDKLSPVQVMRRVFDETPDASLVILFCGSRRGIYGYATFGNRYDPYDLGRAATDAKAKGVFVGVKVLRYGMNDIKKCLKAWGVEYINGISINKDNYYLWEQEQLYSYGD